MDPIDLDGRPAAASIAPKSAKVVLERYFAVRLGRYSLDVHLPIQQSSVRVHIGRKGLRFTNDTLAWFARNPPLRRTNGQSLIARPHSERGHVRARFPPLLRFGSLNHGKRSSRWHSVVNFAETACSDGREYSPLVAPNTMMSSNSAAALDIVACS